MTWQDMGFVRRDTYQLEELDAEKLNLRPREQKVLTKRKQKRRRENGMDAKSAEKIVKNLENFGGIFSADQLENVKILDLPVSLLILDDGHWISVFIGERSLEIMDSAGFTTNEKSNKHLLRFLCAHSYGKELTITPQLQKEDSSDCGKYATTFLCVRTVAAVHLKNFAKLFSDDFDENSKIIDEIFATVKQFYS